MGQLKIERRDAGKVTVLTATGEVDMTTVAEFETALHAALKPSGRSIILSVAGVSLMSSSGWGTALAAAKKVRAAGGDIVFADLSPLMRVVYRELGIAGLLRSFPTESAALAALSSKD